MKNRRRRLDLDLELEPSVEIEGLGTWGRMTAVAEGGLLSVRILGSGIGIYLIRIALGIKKPVILLWRTGGGQILGHTRRRRVARHITRRKHARWTSGRACDRTSRGTGFRERDDYALSFPAVGGQSIYTENTSVSVGQSVYQYTDEVTHDKSSTLPLHS